MTSNQTGVISKTRGQLLREKVNNLCDYLYELQPESKKEIEDIRRMSNEEVVIYVCRDILPRESELKKLVDEWIIFYNVKSTPEIKSKLHRYCLFFCQFMKNN